MTRKSSGRFRAGIKFVELEAGGEKGSGTGITTTRIPAHEALATLEELLHEENLLTDASEGAAEPGQIAVVRGETTFESWELLAKLGDPAQGIATLVAKIHARCQGEPTVTQMRRALQELDKLVKKYGAKSDHDGSSVGSS